MLRHGRSRRGLRSHGTRLWLLTSDRGIATTTRSIRISTWIPLFTTRRTRRSRTTSSPTSEAVLTNWPAPSHVANVACPRARHLLPHTSFHPETHPNRDIPVNSILAETEVRIQPPTINHQVELVRWNTRHGGNMSCSREEVRRSPEQVVVVNVLPDKSMTKKHLLFDPPFVHGFQSLMDLAAQCLLMPERPHPRPPVV